MKTLTYNQRRWALASVLMVALTATASFTTIPQEFGSRDLASTSDEGEVVATRVATDKGVVKVKYIKDGEKVMAVVPKTEGQATCDYCGTYTLDVNFDKSKTDLETLNVALLQKLKPAAEAAPAKPEKAEKAEEGGIVRGENNFEDIEKKCEKKSAEAKPSCLTSELAKKIAKNKNIEQDEVVAFYKDHVAESIRDLVTESQAKVKELSFNRKQYSQEDQMLLGMDPFAQQLEREEYLNTISETRDSIENARKDLAESLRNLVKASGAKYPKLRSEVTKTVTEVMQRSALAVRELRLMAVTDLQNKNHTGFLQKSHEADNLRNELSEWSYKSVNGIEMGLDYLSDRKEISSSDRNVYLKYIQQYNQNMEQILKGPTYNADGTVTMPGLQLNPNSNAATQIQREGLTTINGMTVQLSPELIARIKAETAGGMRTVPESLKPTTSTGTVQEGFYTDGSAYTATPELIQQRQQIRSQFGPK